MIPGDLITLQTKAREADALRVRLTEAKLELQRAQTLMLQMDARYKAVVGNERRLIARDAHNREHAEAVCNSRWWPFLPKVVKVLVWSVLG